MAKMTVVYQTPKDKNTFDKHYFEVHIPLAKRLPGFVKYEVSRGAVTVPRDTSDIYLIGTIYFEM